MRKITPKQQRFVEEYLVDLNATQAAIRAGYAKKSADVEGSRLLVNAKVAAAVAEGCAKQEERAEIEADDVIRELAKIGFANMADYVRIMPDGDPAVDLGNLTRDQFAAVGEVTVEDFTDGRGEDSRNVRRVKFKLADKRAALVDLGRHFALFTDKQNVTHHDGDRQEIEEAADAFTRSIARLVDRNKAAKAEMKH